MLVLLLAAALAAPVEVAEREVVDTLGQKLIIRTEGKDTYLVLKGERDAFACEPGWGGSYRAKTMTKFAEKLQEVVQNLSPTRDLQFEPARTGIAGSSAEGYCNLHASTKEGTAFLTFTYNRACFGSAGCNTDKVTLVANDTFLRSATQLLQWGAAQH